ncbi:MAG: helix-turn-helix domain-containing protein [Patescibacteria group bacterium]
MKKAERKKALQLRAKGKSLNEIARVLSVSKSTASVWCKDIKISGAAKKRLAARTKQKSVAGLERYLAERKKQKEKDIIKNIEQGMRQLGVLSERDVYCIGLGLYWGEGYKKGSQEFGFTNSDPQMIIFYLHWLESVFGVSRDKLILRVSINQLHSYREKDVLRFWSKTTGVPLRQFTKTSFIKTRSLKMYANQGVHMGTLRVKVRSGTSMRRQVLGAIKAIPNSQHK